MMAKVGLCSLEENLNINSLPDWLVHWNPEDPVVVDHDVDEMIPPGLLYEVDRDQPTDIVESYAAGLKTALVSRLKNLCQWSYEEGDEQEPVKTKSLIEAISFLREFDGLIEPELILTYTGNIRAEWIQSKDEKVIIEFLGDGLVKHMQYFGIMGNTRVKPRLETIHWNELLERFSKFKRPDFIVCRSVS